MTHCLYERAVEILARLCGIFTAPIGNKYQIRLTRPIKSMPQSIGGENVGTWASLEENARGP